MIKFLPSKTEVWANTTDYNDPYVTHRDQKVKVNSIIAPS